MNLYILVEGRKTERILYPIWIKYLAPHMKRVTSISDVVANNFYLISGEGYPSLLDVKLEDSLKDIRQQGNFDVFWIVLDSDDETVDARRDLVFQRVNDSGIDIGNCLVEVIVQKPCIETWGLGNRSMISVNQLHGDMSGLFRHYNVRDNDPELMEKEPVFLGSNSLFHERYLKEMLLEKQIRYSKKNPNGLKEEYYLNELISRAQAEEGHLSSFLFFYQKIQSL